MGEDATIYPERQETRDVAEISGCDDRIDLVSPKNSIIIDTIKSLGWRWDRGRGVWSRSITYTTGSACDRIAEAGNALLNAGVPVRIFDEGAREKAINGEYEPECKRWILGDCDNKIWAKWNGMNDELYNAAMSLPHARYRDGHIVLDTAYWDEIRDFAKLYNFGITEAADKALKNEEEKQKNVKRVNPAAPKKAEKKDALGEILNSSRDILEDLKEED